jgi:hypothetical protein
MKYAIEINQNVKTGKLIFIKNTKHYLIDSLKYSYPFLIPKAQNLLNLIGEKFQSKINNTNLKNTRFVVTSLLRTKSSTTRLRRKNKNAIRYSAHLHGTTFDITYEDFENQKNITPIEKESLKEILANILFELRKQKKCWVTYEYFQNCFHIVSR